MQIIVMTYMWCLYQGACARHVNALKYKLHTKADIDRVLKKCKYTVFTTENPVHENPLIHYAVTILRKTYIIYVHFL